QSNSNQSCQRTHKGQRTKENHHAQKKTTREAHHSNILINNLPVYRGEPTQNSVVLVDNY
ncbi:hypothetical protein EMCG_01109, partial [[Emmonsia] crescens]